MRFLVISGAPLFVKDDVKAAYPPYVREMDIWFSQVQNIKIVSPGTYPFSFPTKEFKRQDVGFTSLSFLQFKGVRKSIISLLSLPGILLKLKEEMRETDHIHLRCPGNISLLGCMIQIFFPSKSKTVKYAGNWDPQSHQPFSYKLQKAIIRNSFLSKNMKVLVYGDWPEQSKNIVPFFTASFRESEKETIVKDFREPLKMIFAGALVKGKRPMLAIKLVEKLRSSGVDMELDLFGEGELKKTLENYIQKNQLCGFIRLNGSVPLEELKQEYKKAHFLILASKSEGWPKAMAEAMFFGCIPVSTSVSCVPWMLDYGKRGVLLGSGSDSENEDDRESILIKRGFDQIRSLMGKLEVLKEMSTEAMRWSQQYTLEKFEAEIEKLLISEEQL
ncbi:glycosyltransferase [Salegentibacter chungangensis]|uniref:Glycosyltransferase n=1 Tax=Salegentibacter chungangensis TaxID=1335724 RepID=A0ABW3NSD7_9FLAO